MDAKQIQVVRQKLRAAISDAGTDPTSIARAIGRGKDYVRDFLDDRKDSLAAASITALEKELRLPRGYFLDDASTSGISRPIEPPGRSADQIEGRDLPVYAAAEGGAGEMVVDSEAIDFVPRPWFLGTVKKPYAVRVVGESMIHAYEPGDIVIINPKLEHARNKNHIFVSGEDQGEFRASIKRLRGWSETDWQVEQFNPPKKFNLSKKEWPKALRIVGKYEG